MCRRCGTDLVPQVPDVPPLPQAPRLALDREPFSPLWLIVAIVGYVALLFGAFQLFRGTFEEYAEVLRQIRTPADVRLHADALSDFALKAFALVFSCYLAGGILLGRFARGRVLMQTTVAAPISWLAIFLQGGVGGPLLLPMIIGGAIVTGTAALGAWVGRALRPKR